MRTIGRDRDPLARGRLAAARRRTLVATAVVAATVLPFGPRGEGAERSARWATLGAPSQEDLTTPRPLPLVDGRPEAWPGVPPAAPAAPAPDRLGPAERVTPAVPERAAYTVQVGAFRTADAARRLAGWLAQRGYPAFVVSVDLGPAGHGVWHRVRIGPYEGREAAEAAAGRVTAAEGLPARVLREARPPGGASRVDTPGMER